MWALRWLPEALQDLKGLLEFIEPHSTQAAARAIESLLASAEGLLEFPEMGRPWGGEPDFRELPVKFGARGYVIRYRLLDDEILIVRVWHALEQR